jgi:hypothetical protein
LVTIQNINIFKMENELWNEKEEVVDEQMNIGMFD